MKAWWQPKLPLQRQGKAEPYWDTGRPADALAHLRETQAYWEQDSLAWWGAFLTGRFAGRAYPQGFYITDFSLVERSWGFCVFCTIRAEGKPDRKLYAKAGNGREALKAARALIKAGEESWVEKTVPTTRDKRPADR